MEIKDMVYKFDNVTLLICFSENEISFYQATLKTPVSSMYSATGLVPHSANSYSANTGLR